VSVSFSETRLFLENWKKEDRQERLGCHMIHTKWKLYWKKKRRCTFKIIANNLICYMYYTAPVEERYGYCSSECV
jgi:hypothetical protein